MRVPPPIEELAAAETPAGTVSLRRRWDDVLGADAFEVRLGDEYLMSSLFTDSEVELARLGLSHVTAAQVDVVVGGLGLGFTARAVLEDPRVRSLVVVDALEPVIAWHRQGLVPDAEVLTDDDRVRLDHGDFFELAMSDDGFVPEAPGTRFAAILVDIDHSPTHHLAPTHAPFYTAAGLTRTRTHLQPAGVFALWSNDPPDDGFTQLLAEVFGDATAQPVSFTNPYQGGESSCTVYVATATPV